MNQNKNEIGAAIPTEDMIEWLTQYADSGLKYTKWQMILGIASRLRWLDQENKRLRAQIEALKKDAAKAVSSNCLICKHSGTNVMVCECDCTECKLVCKCRDCTEGSHWEWRGECDCTKCKLVCKCRDCTEGSHWEWRGET